LLNVSPTGDGTLLPQSVERLKAVGKWMKINSDSIYGKSASPFANLEWGRCTAKPVDGDTLLYLHVFDWPKDGKLRVPSLKNDLQSASLLADGTMLKSQTTDAGIELSLPSEAPDEIATVIVLKVNGALEVGTQLPTPSTDGLLVLPADSVYIHNNEGSKQANVRVHDNIPHIGYWMDPPAWVEWSIQINRPGRYEVRAILPVEKEKTQFGYGLLGQLQMVQVKSTGSYGTMSKTHSGRSTSTKLVRATFKSSQTQDNGSQ
jgi:alpha-L-fucosidase